MRYSYPWVVVKFSLHREAEAYRFIATIDPGAFAAAFILTPAF
jgi:hypothetical protein